MKKNTKIITIKPLTLLAAALVALLFARLIAQAWVADDAYITFRVVDNIVNGYGAVWNANERAQVYTHPLWMLLHIPFHALWGDIYHTTILLSLACFAAALAYAIRAQSLPPAQSAIAIALPLTISLPIAHYAVCGLENPLSMLLVAAFAYHLKPAPNYKWKTLAIISALMVLNRIDLGLITAPFWLCQLAKHKGKLPYKQFLPGAALLALWFTFSLVYYGFVFPNTKFAKLHSGAPTAELITHGLYYVLDLCIRDLASVILIACILYASIRSRTSPQRLMLALGGLLYILYIIAIGGDFMGGRFWAVPVFLFAILLPSTFPATFFARPRTLLIWCLSLAAIFTYSEYQRAQALAICMQDLPPPTGTEEDKEVVCGVQGIIDERSFYDTSTTLFTPGSWLPRAEISGLWAEKGRELRAAPPAEAQVIGASGMIAYEAGPAVIFIDKFALGEPLLARLPMKAGEWRIGHFERAIPEGYVTARSTGDTGEMDESLAQYYLRLRKILADPLFSPTRLRTIWGFQTGEYAPLRNDYVTRHCEEFYQSCQ